MVVLVVRDGIRASEGRKRVEFALGVLVRSVGILENRIEQRHMYAVVLASGPQSASVAEEVVHAFTAVGSFMKLFASCRSTAGVNNPRSRPVRQRSSHYWHIGRGPDFSSLA
ncbi:MULTISPECIES: hypothetical protein [unclassified Streptomyces]|uniref:hypothetical protein n=1 Tax=unclassified Streptomyces TaxID=2593676 RepID=UPI003820633F